jgi:hypothetical protein
MFALRNSKSLSTGLSFSQIVRSRDLRGTPLKSSAIDFVALSQFAQYWNVIDRKKGASQEQHVARAQAFGM